MDPTLPHDTLSRRGVLWATGLLATTLVLLSVWRGSAGQPLSWAAPDLVALLCGTPSASVVVAVATPAGLDLAQALARGDAALKTAEDGKLLHLDGNLLPILALAPADASAALTEVACRDVTADLAPVALALGGEGTMQQARWQMARQVGSDG